MLEEEMEIDLHIDFIAGKNFASITEAIWIINDSDLNWSLLETKLKEYPNHIKVQYIDDDLDHVDLDCEEELQEAIKVARNKCNNKLKLRVICAEPIEYSQNYPDGYASKQQYDTVATQQLEILAKLIDATREEADLGKDAEIGSDNLVPKEIVSNAFTCHHTGCNRDKQQCYFRDPQGYDPYMGEAALIPGTALSNTNIRINDNAKMRCFYLRCASTDLVLDVFGGDTSPGQPVILWPRKRLHETARNQLWFQEGSTIRSLLHFFCIDLQAGTVVVEPFDASKRTTQNWQYDEQKQRLTLCSKEWLTMGVSGPTYPGQVVQIGLSSQKIVEDLRLVKDYEDRVMIAVNNWKTPYDQMFRERYTYTEVRPAAVDYGQSYTGHCHNDRQPSVDNNRYNHTTPADEAVRHVGVVCDVCDKDIIGVRYKCCSCVNYDLCETCESLDGVHERSHILLKIKVPIKRNASPGFDPYFVPLSLAAELEADTFMAESQTLMHRLLDKQHREVTCGMLNVEFVADYNFPAGSCVQPGSRITKTWIVRNTGTLPWASKTVLRHVQGSLVYHQTQVSVPYIQPGQIGTLIVELIAPHLPGFYDSHWQLFGYQGPFGPMFSCKVIVDTQAELVLTNKEEGVALVRDVSEHERNVIILSDILSGMDTHQRTCDLIESLHNLSVPEDKRESEHLPSTQTPTNTDTNDIETIDMLDGTVPKETTVTTVDAKVIDLLDVEYDVLEEMSGHSTNSDYEYISSVSTTSDSSDSSSASDDEDQDFHIIPIPDCFITELPARLTASTVVIVKKSDVTGTMVNLDSSVDIAGIVVNNTTECECSPIPEDEQNNVSFEGILGRDDHVVYMFSRNSGNVEIVGTHMHEFGSVSEDSDDEEGTDKWNDVSRTGDHVYNSYMVESNDSVVKHEYERVSEGSVNEACEQLNTVQLCRWARQSEASDAGGIDAVYGVDILERDLTVEGLRTCGLESGDNDDEEDQQCDVSETVDMLENGETIEGSKDDDEKFTEAEALGDCPVNKDHDVSNSGSCESSDEEETAEANEHSQQSNRKHHNIEELVFSAVTSAVGAASKAATGAFSTLKDVYNTLQVKNTYSPPKSSWTPPTNVWMPPSNSWTSDQAVWTPAREAWMPATEPWTPPPSSWRWMPVQPSCSPLQSWVPHKTSDSAVSIVEGAAVAADEPYRPTTDRDNSPMEQLVEMGFANRELNALVLAECNDDLSLAIQRIIQLNDN